MRNMKVACAVVLLACLFLPLSSCSRCVDSQGNMIAECDPENLPAGVTMSTSYTYPLDHFDYQTFQDWLFLLCFLWPIPLLIHRYKSRGTRLKNMLWAIEPLCAIGASWYIYTLANILAQPAFGTYAAIAANVAYGLVWLAEVIMKFKNKQPAAT